MAKKSDMDPDRLAQVQQSELTESRVNEDFVEWLKKWGNSILLVILLIALAGVAWNWWQQKIDDTIDTAWTNLNLAQLPASLEDVAADSKQVGSVSTLALIRAADEYLISVQNGVPLGMLPNATDAPELDDATRLDYLNNADRLYAEAITSVGDYGSDFAKKLLVCSGLFGQAAVAESLGEIDRARTLLESVTTTANPEYPQLAEQATERINSLEPLGTRIALPAEADLPKPPEPVVQPDALELLRGGGLEVTPSGDGETAEPSEVESLIIEGASSPENTPAEPEPAAEPAVEPAAEPAAEPTTEPAGGADGG